MVDSTQHVVDEAFAWEVRGDGVAVSPEESSERSAGGVYLPDQVREKPLVGTIIALGPLAGKERGPLRVGDVVAFGRYDGTELRVGYRGRPVFLLRDEHVRLAATPSHAAEHRAEQERRARSRVARPEPEKATMMMKEGL